MATLSSHFLNGTNGTHAAAVGVRLFRVDKAGIRCQVFASESDEGGRFCHDFEAVSGEKYEMVIASDDYFKNQNMPINSNQILSEIIIRFCITDPKECCHIPVIMSPNSYSCWWSS